MDKKHRPEEPLVSVGLPTYNRPEALDRALDILCEQTYKNIEILVSDNASPDDRVKVVALERLKQDTRIKYFRQDRNTGVLFNAEAALREANGKYFMWFSDDDWRAPQFIETLVSQLEKHPECDLAFCDYYEVKEDGARASGYPVSHLPIFKPFTHKNRLWRRLLYYWQDAANGKSNLFYSLIRKTALDDLSLSKISGNFSYLNMDGLIVFNLLKRSHLALVSETMCTLTCGNVKHYDDGVSGKGDAKRGLWRKIRDFYQHHQIDRKRFLENTQHPVEVLGIYTLFLPKVCFLLMQPVKRTFRQRWRKFKETVGTLYYRLSSKAYGAGTIPPGDKLQLPQVTLIALATKDVEATYQGLLYSCRGVDFGDVKLISHYKPEGFDDNKVKYEAIEPMATIDDWCKTVVYDLGDYVETDFALLVHADGFVVNPSSWRDDFLEYDYIGAPWPLPEDDFSYRDIHGNIVRQGNSVGLRSKKLLDFPREAGLLWEPLHGFYNEDGFICVKNRHIFEDAGMKFAPLDVAKYLSHENMIPEIKGIKPFAFHKWAGSNRIYPRF